MLSAALPWQLAHDLPFAPALSAHSFWPRAAHNMPGLAKSSACSARVSLARNSTPDLRGAGRCGSAAQEVDAHANATLANAAVIRRVSARIVHQVGRLERMAASPRP